MMWFSICLDWSLSKSNGFNLPFFVAAYWLSSGCICVCCHCSLSKSWKCCFQCAITAHLISIGCISINVVNAVSLNSEYDFLDVLKSIRYGLPCVLTAYLISTEWIFILCYVAVLIYYIIVLFHLVVHVIFHVFTILFQRAVHAIFLVLSLHIQ